MVKVHVKCRPYTFIKLILPLFFKILNFRTVKIKQKTTKALFTLQVLILNSDFLLVSCGCSHYNLNPSSIKLQRELSKRCTETDMRSHGAHSVYRTEYGCYTLTCGYRFWNCCAIRTYKFASAMLVLFNTVLIFCFQPTQVQQQVKLSCFCCPLKRQTSDKSSYGQLLFPGIYMEVC